MLSVSCRDYIEMKLWYLCLFFFPHSLFCQISGIVVDAESNVPISGAGIYLNNTLVTTTAEDGQFIVNDLIDHTLFSVRHQGYSEYSDTIRPDTREFFIKLNPNIHQLSEVMVSTSLYSQKLKTVPGNESLLTRKDLENSNNIELSSILNQVSGVYMQQGSLNTSRLTIRGIGSRTPYSTNRIKAYFDEIPLTSGDGTTTVEDIDLAAVGRIEVIKGPASAVFGAGLGGIVKFYPERYNENNIFSFTSQAGSFGTFKNILSATFKISSLSVNAIYSNVYSDGFRENSRYKRNSVFVFGTREKQRARLNIILNYVGLNSRIPSSVDEVTFMQNPHLAAQNWLRIKGYEEYNKFIGGFTYSTGFAKQIVNQVTLFNSFFDHYESRPFNILADNSFNVGLRDKITLHINQQKIIAGFEWFNEYYKWKIFETNDGQEGNLQNYNKENRNYLNAFLLWVWSKPDKWNIEAGINFNSLGYKVTDLFLDSVYNSGRYRYKPVLSPKFGINYQVSSKVNIYSSAGHGFSHPSLEETLLPQGQPNPNLKPEDGYNVEIGMRVNLLEDRLYADVNHYWLFLTNLLVTRRISEDIFTGENLGKTNHRGIECLLKYKLVSELPENRSAVELSLSFSGSVNKFKSFIDNSRTLTNNHLPGMPAEILSTNVYLKTFKVLKFNIQYQIIGEQYLDDENTKSYKGHQLLGIRAAMSKTIFRKYQFDLYGGIQNVLDQQYASMILVNAPKFGTSAPRYYYPGEPINFYLGLRATIK